MPTLCFQSFTTVSKEICSMRGIIVGFHTLIKHSIGAVNKPSKDIEIKTSVDNLLNFIFLYFTPNILINDHQQN